MPNLLNQAVFAPFPLKVAWSGISLIEYNWIQRMYSNTPLDLNVMDPM